MAAAEGRRAEAVDYLDRAVRFCEEKGLVVELAHSRLGLADALLHRNPMTGQPVAAAVEAVGAIHESPLQGSGGLADEPSAEDRVRASRLLDQALADYQRLGMPLYVQDALARRALLKA